MTTEATRPALADVLACLTVPRFAAVWSVALAPPKPGALINAVPRVTTGGAGIVHRIATSPRRAAFLNDVEFLAPQPWRHDTPAAALESLVAAGLLPEHWTDAARAPRWWCEACEGVGAVFDVWRMRCWRCDGSGHTALPPSHPALVAVAGLGVDTLARAEAIVAETWPGRALAWRPMTAAALQKHHADHCAGLDVTPALVFSREMTPPLTNFEWRPAWPEVCPYGGLFGTPDDDRHGVHRAWPALRALAALGLHLVALDASRVVIAVEALS
jgi:hypothetical protein